MKRLRPGKPTHANAATLLGGASPRRLGPIPEAWRGWTPRLAALTRLRGLAASSARLSACSGGAAQARLPPSEAAPPGPLRAPVVLAFGSRLDAWTCPASRGTLAARESDGGSRACAGAGAAPPQLLTAAGAAWSAVAALRSSAPPGPDRSCWGRSRSGGSG